MENSDNIKYTIHRIDMFMNKGLALYITIICICLLNYLVSRFVFSICKYSKKLELYKKISFLVFITSILWLIIAIVWHLYWW